MGRAARPKKSSIRGRKPRARKGDPGVIAATRGRPIRGGFGARWQVAATWSPNFDAVTGIDHITDAVLAEHYFAIREGVRAGDGSLQPKLLPRGKQGSLAANGQRPNIRGFTGRTTTPFSDNIERSAIKIKKKPVKLKVGTLGTKAVSSIRPDKLHRGFVGFELRRGHQYFFADGPVLEVVDEALGQWLDLAIDGRLARSKMKKRKAKRAKAK